MAFSTGGEGGQLRTIHLKFLFMSFLTCIGFAARAEELDRKVSIDWQAQRMELDFSRVTRGKKTLTAIVPTQRTCHALPPEVIATTCSSGATAELIEIFKIEDQPQQGIAIYQMIWELKRGSPAMRGSQTCQIQLRDNLRQKEVLIEAHL